MLLIFKIRRVWFSYLASLHEVGACYMAEWLLVLFVFRDFAVKLPQRFEFLSFIQKLPV